jgi:hypothetical protein
MAWNGEQNMKVPFFYLFFRLTKIETDLFRDSQVKPLRRLRRRRDDDIKMDLSKGGDFMLTVLAVLGRITLEKNGE